MKYLGINLTKKVTYLYTEKYKTLMKEIEKHAHKKETYPVFLDCCCSVAQLCPTLCNPMD